MLNQPWIDIQILCPGNWARTSYEFLLPLRVSQIKSTMRITSLTIFLSHMLFFSCFFRFIFCIFLEGKDLERTIYYVKTCIMYKFGFHSHGELVNSNFPVYKIFFFLLSQGTLEPKLGNWSSMSSLRSHILRNLLLQKVLCSVKDDDRFLLSFMETCRCLNSSRL